MEFNTIKNKNKYVLDRNRGLHLVWATQISSQNLSFNQEIRIALTQSP